LEEIAAIVVNNDKGKIHFCRPIVAEGKDLKLPYYPIIAQFNLNFNGIDSDKKDFYSLSTFSKMPNGIR